MKKKVSQEDQTKIKMVAEQWVKDSHGKYKMEVIRCNQ